MTSVADRLFKQIKLQQEREATLHDAETLLATAIADRQAAKEHRNKAEEQHEKIVQLQKALEKQMKENSDAIQAMSAQHDAERKLLMEELNEKVASVNTRVETTAVRKAKAEHENAKLKEQIGILEAHKSSGSDKFNEIMNAREKEEGGFLSQLEKEEKISELLAQQNEMTKLQIDKLTTIHDALKAKADVYAAKFNHFQEQIKAARSIFDESQKTRERLTRKLLQLKEDREQAKLRTARSRKDYEAEETKVALAEKQADELEMAIKKIQELTQALLNPSSPTSNAPADPPAAIEQLD